LRKRPGKVLVRAIEICGGSAVEKGRSDAAGLLPNGGRAPIELVVLKDPDHIAMAWRQIKDLILVWYSAG